LAEVFLAFEGQDVEDGVEPVDGELVASVVEENGSYGVHVQTSLRNYGEASFPSLVQLLDSFGETDTR
jgi:hypothetical protein